MTKLSTLLFATILCGVVAATPLLAADSSTEVKALGQAFEHPASDASYSKDMRDDEILAKSKPAENGKIQYVSGGIAESGMRAIDAEEHLYNLKLLFVAEPTGEYLADVGVKIMDSKGNNVLDTVTKGPVLLVKMAPGRYTIDATRKSGAKLTQNVEAGNDHLSSYVVRYPTKR